MATVNALNVNGTSYEVEDTSARSQAEAAQSTANAATTSAKTAAGKAAAAGDEAERNRQAEIGKYPGRDIASLLSGEMTGGKTVYDALHARVAAANFAGLRIGDYIDVPLANTTGVTSDKRARMLIAHFDPYYQCADLSKGHHIAFVASAPVAVASDATGAQNGSYLQWNTTNTNQGTADEKRPYLCSNIKAWETSLEACLPEALTKYLLTQRVLLEERYSANGALSDSNSWSWADIGKVWSLSEMEVYGCPVWGTSGYSVGFDCQFDLFHDTARRLNGSRYPWWLRSVASGSSAYVCYVNGTGNANYGSATNGWVRPRPGFLVG